MVKPIVSELAETQTVAVEKVDSRISVRTRQVDRFSTTEDIMVDGYVHTPALSQERRIALLPRIKVVVHEDNRNRQHFGYGQFAEKGQS